MNICAGGLSASSGKEEGLSIEVPLFVYPKRRLQNCVKCRRPENSFRLAWSKCVCYDTKKEKKRNESSQHLVDSEALSIVLSALLSSHC